MTNEDTLLISIALGCAQLVRYRQSKLHQHDETRQERSFGRNRPCRSYRFPLAFVFSVPLFGVPNPHAWQSMNEATKCSVIEIPSRGEVVSRAFLLFFGIWPSAGVGVSHRAYFLMLFFYSAKVCVIFRKLGVVPFPSYSSPLFPKCCEINQFPPPPATNQ